MHDQIEQVIDAHLPASGRYDVFEQFVIHRNLGRDIEGLARKEFATIGSRTTESVHEFHAKLGFVIRIS